MSGGGGDGSGTNTVQKADPWIGVQPYLGNMYSWASAQPAAEFYPGQTYATRNPYTSEGQIGSYQYSKGSLPQQIQWSTDALRQSLAGPDVANNPYVNSMIDAQRRQVTDALNTQWLPQIAGQSAAAGQWGGGTRAGVAQGVAAGRAADALANAAAQTQLSAYSQGLDQQRAAMTLAPQVAQMGLMPSQLQQQYGTQQEEYAQKEINDAMARWNFNQQKVWDLLNRQNAIYSGVPWGQTTNASTTGGGSSPLAGAIGGGLGGYALGGALSGLLGSGAGAAGGAAGGAAAGAASGAASGASLGPWGALAGAVLGAMLSRK